MPEEINTTTNPTTTPAAPVGTSTPSATSTTPAPAPQAEHPADWKPEDVPQLTVDVYRKDDTIFVVSTVAGVNPEHLDISVEGNNLTIRGMRNKPYDHANVQSLLEECFWGEFYRELTINENLDIDGVKANLQNGILTISIPILKIVTQKKVSIDFK